MLKLQNICKKFESLSVLENFSLEIRDSEIVAVTGPSGCGKTTLLNIIAGITKPDSGLIEKNSEKIGYVFQEDRLLPWLNVWENIKLVNKKRSKEEIQHFIDSVSLTGFENYTPDKLSGGMKQRCSIARALNYGASLLLLDEPFSGLDADLRNKLITDLLEINKSQKTAILIVTHNLEEAEALGAKIITI